MITLEEYPYQTNNHFPGIDCILWCTDQFGHSGWTVSNDRFGFKEEKHLTLFMLRWK